jgi:hypothetical protein
MQGHRVVAGAAVAIVIALAGCGSSVSSPHAFSGPTYSAAEVTARFAAVTGIELQRAPGRTSYWVNLSPTDAVSQDPQWGVFSIYVLRSPRYLAAVTSDTSQLVAPDSQGIYWTYVRGAYPGWSAAKVYGNVVLSVPGGARRKLPATFTNLNRVLSTMSEPVSVARAAVPSVPTFGGPEFTAQQVAARFEAQTGYTLAVDTSSVTWDTLQPSNPEVLDGIYGIFTIDVLHNAETLPAVLGDQAHPIKPDAQGIYWTYDPNPGGGWTANKTYGNVVLQWTGVGAKHALGAGFYQLDRILSGLGKPAATPPGVVRTCQAAGIAVAGTKQGTCLDDSVKLIVVNRGDRLRLNGYAVRVTGTRVAKSISGQDGAPPTRAKGEFVIVAVRVTNTGHSPLDQPVDAELVSTQVYQADGFAEASLQPFGMFPLRRGASASTHLVFDVPPGAVGVAVRGGAIFVPGDSDATVQTDTQLGVSRLG